MKWIEKHKNGYSDITLSSLQLLVISIVAIFLVVLVQFTETKSPQNRSDKMLLATKKMNEAKQVLSSFCDKNNLEINRQNDPLHTGFIGIEFSPITTTLGDLKAKQTSTNPDFAALFIHWFDEIRLKKGDKIVINTSGSFPALGIAAIIASEVYGLEPIIISSIGASSFGANNPSLTYWDIESLLFQKSIISNKTSFATLGGQEDNGSSFWEGGLVIAKDAIERNSLQAIIPNNLFEAIENKTKFLNSQKPFRLFINIGGNQSALGNAPCSMQLPHGLIKNKIGLSDSSCFGLIHKINQMDIPIIHMLNIRDLALENGIDLLPNYNQKLGVADIYFTKQKPKLIIGFSILFLILIIGTMIKQNSK